MKLGEVVRIAGKHAQRLTQSGGAPIYTGIPGMMALMGDNIRRYFEEDQDDDEILNLAGNALLVLKLVLDRLPQEEIEDGPAPKPASEPHPSNSRSLQPPPPEFEGWQFNDDKAAALHNWLVETDQWDLLNLQQQEGILLAAAGHVDRPPNRAEAGEHDEDVL